MSILRGHFAVTLIVALPADASRSRLAKELEGVRERLALEAVSISEVESLPEAVARPSHVLSVYGADHPGIVHRVTSALAQRQINVTDLSTQLTGSDQLPVYVMLIELALGKANEEELATVLSTAGEELSVEVSLRRLGAEAL